MNTVRTLLFVVMGAIGLGSGYMAGNWLKVQSLSTVIIFVIGFSASALMCGYWLHRKASEEKDDLLKMPEKV